MTVEVCEDSPRGNPVKEELVQAIRQKRVADVRELLSAGANPDARDAEGDCVLWWAANDGHVEIVRLLGGWQKTVPDNRR